MYGKNAAQKYSGDALKEVYEFAEDYRLFLSNSKTERLMVTNSRILAEEAGFRDISEFIEVVPGDKVYVVNKNKNIALFVVGEDNLANGLNILGAHIDSPRMDVKQNPLYESTEFALLDTHYYGGIKKYQFVARPLALYGVVCKKDGTTVEVNIGDNEGDPVVGVSDLLIHLSGDQLQKPAAKVIEGEALDLTVGSLPLESAEKDKVKANVLRILKEKYNIDEEDFLSAEIEVVPAGPARDYGLDASMIAGYGHDDKVCAYTSLRAILDLEEVPDRTVCTILVDKEEVGSIGSTGAHSRFFENAIAKLMNLKGEYSELALRDALANSKMLSSDVSAGVDPLFIGVNELKNSCFLNHGIVFNKYTGSRGKSGCNDANAEFVAEIRRIMDNNDIYYQTAEIGKVDQGGGGTIAYILANLNMDVIDAGIPVLNMHAPMEIVSKIDVFEAYKAYLAFIKNA
ncbi:MAG: aminopeptidase [Bacilli bacterium]|nr:aminopeptidase [Bacilli bacterium]